MKKNKTCVKPRAKCGTYHRIEYNHFMVLDRPGIMALPCGGERHLKLVINEQILYCNRAYLSEFLKSHRPSKTYVAVAKDDKSGRILGKETKIRSVTGPCDFAFFHNNKDISYKYEACVEEKTECPFADTYLFRSYFVLVD